ncbi:hypothetical protein D3C72_818020 [compost metagenome]
MDPIFHVVVPVVIGLIPAYIAKQKGRNFLLWWFFGAGLFILALPAALLMKSTVKSDAARRTTERTQEPVEAGASDDRRSCPHCAESIKKEARFCRFCQLEVGSVSQSND